MSADAFSKYAGRRVLVTGHTGFKGSWLCLWLKRLGAEVAGFSDAIPTDPSHFEALRLDMDDRRGDICNPAAVDAVIADTKPDAVFHFAAQSLVRKAYADPLATYRANVLGTLAVLQSAQRSGAGSVVVATTDKAKSQLRIQDALQLAEKVGFPSWVEVDPKKMTGTFKGAPDRSEFGQDINESLVVELYSK